MFLTTYPVLSHINLCVNFISLDKTFSVSGGSSSRMSSTQINNSLGAAGDSQQTPARAARDSLKTPVGGASSGIGYSIFCIEIFDFCSNCKNPYDNCIATFTD